MPFGFSEIASLALASGNIFAGLLETGTEFERSPEQTELLELLKTRASEGLTGEERREAFDLYTPIFDKSATQKQQAVAGALASAGAGRSSALPTAIAGIPRGAEQAAQVVGQMDISARQEGLGQLTSYQQYLDTLEFQTEFGAKQAGFDTVGEGIGMFFDILNPTKGFDFEEYMKFITSQYGSDPFGDPAGFESFIPTPQTIAPIDFGDNPFGIQ